jgi:tRNA threonylcarbamoyladenosine modification (KEOPS) complex Cgi121 subunit
MSFAKKMNVTELKGAFGRRVVGVFGCRGAVAGTDEFLRRIAAIDREIGTTSQVFDALRIAGAEHLMHAARLALTAHATKKNFASSLGVELMCWAAAERQIGRAFEKVGVRQGSMEMAFVVVGKSRTQVKGAIAKISQELAVEQDDAVLEINPKKNSMIKRTFSISSKELRVAPLKKLVLERVALLALSK